MAGGRALRFGATVNSWRAQRIVAVGVWVFVLGNLGAIVAIWAGGGADGIGYRWHSVTQALLCSGRLAALLAGFLALIQVLLLARLPFIERLAGFDRLTVWHRWNGQAVRPSRRNGMKRNGCGRPRNAIARSSGREGSFDPQAGVAVH